MKEESLIANQADFIRFRKVLYAVLNRKYLNIGLYLMIASYFYNLPVLTYSAIGSNEFRIYDFAGLALIYAYVMNYAMVTRYIKQVKIFRSLFVFLNWCAFTMIFTGISSILANKILWLIQSLLYLYHFWAFFLTGVFFSIVIQDSRKLKNLVTATLVMASAAFFVVLLQNLGLVKFLWNRTYEISYFGFLSGTFGPNKIVLGMSCLFIFALCIGLLNDRRVKLNKPLLLITLGLSALVIIISGSRTAYVGLAVFLLYFSVRETRSFVYSLVLLMILILGIASFKPEILDKAAEVYTQRVESKIQDEEDLQEARVDNLYEDLGSGRKEILVKYIGLLADEYYYIPLGRGFNNRLATYSSAHNMYLSLIYEVGVVGLILFCRWLYLYFFIRLRQFRKMQMALRGLLLANLVCLFFGEHLYIYRPLFGLLGLFIFIATILSSPIFILNHETGKTAQG